MKVYSKAIAALAAALAVAGSVAADGSLTLSDWIAVLSAAVGALAVYAVPNQGN